MNRAMIDHERLTRWYDFQAPIYHYWRDDYDGSLIAAVSGLLSDNHEGSPKKALDVGCGSGLLAIGLGQKHPDWEITGVDPSAGLLKIARREAGKRGLTKVVFAEGVVARLAYQGAEFDLVVAAGLFPNINDHLGALVEIKRVLKPDGTLAIIEFDRTNLGAPGRVFFNVMIMGYRLFSWAFRCFRFADDWNIEKSTIDTEAFLATLSQAGFRIHARHHAGDHVIFVLGNVES